MLSNLPVGDAGESRSQLSHTSPRLPFFPRQEHYSSYLDPKIPLIERVKLAFEEIGISPDNQSAIQAVLEPLKLKHYPTYEHCLRVGLLARAIGKYLKSGEAALFYAGILHDCGKALCPDHLLTKTEEWTLADSIMMQKHVSDGHVLLKSKFPFTADVIVWHHRFQKNSYPEQLPPLNEPYSIETLNLIKRYGRILAIADSFDALHRVNSRHMNSGSGALTGEQIKGLMLEDNIDERDLIEKLYSEKILTTIIYPPSLSS